MSEATMSSIEPTSSGSEAGTSSASKEDGKPDVKLLAQNVFEKLSEYIADDLQGTADDYKLLEEMNDVVGQKYSDMTKVASSIKTSLQELNDKYINLQPYLDQVDEIDHSSRRLEEVAYALDAYVKNLELKFKVLEKR